MKSSHPQPELPSRDFDLSKRFYVDLGFQLAWSSDDLAYLHAGRSSFLLSKFYRKEFAENLMMHLLVEDVEAWWRHTQDQQIGQRYGVNVNPPEDRSQMTALAKCGALLWQACVAL